MIILLIKTDQPQAEIYLYNDSELLARLLWQADRHLAETISLKIDDLLKRASLSFEAIAGIGVFIGPGSFTGLRIGIAVANTMSYGLGLPIVGSRDEDWIIKAVTRLIEGDNDKIAEAHYGAPPRITKPKK